MIYNINPHVQDPANWVTYRYKYSNNIYIGYVFLSRSGLGYISSVRHLDRTKSWPQTNLIIDWIRAYKTRTIKYTLVGIKYTYIEIENMLFLFVLEK